MANYEINIELSQQTINALAQGGYALWALKAVRAQGGGAPLLWYSTSNFTSVMRVTWQDQYAAYASTSQIIANAVINPESSVEMDLGQTVDLTPTGALQAGGRGAPGAISILNQDSRQWTVGQSQSIDGESSPVCALPLYRQMQSQIVPVEQVLLMFSSNAANTGTVMERAVSQGLLVDLTAQKSRTVQFDVNSGWNTPGTWARQVTPNTDLVPLLIQD
jgi:hypothetical protein